MIVILVVGVLLLLDVVHGLCRLWVLKLRSQGCNHAGWTPESRGSRWYERCRTLGCRMQRVRQRQRHRPRRT